MGNGDNRFYLLDDFAGYFAPLRVGLGLWTELWIGIGIGIGIGLGLGARWFNTYSHSFIDIDPSWTSHGPLMDPSLNCHVYCNAIHYPSNWKFDPLTLRTTLELRTTLGLRTILGLRTTLGLQSQVQLCLANQ